MPKHITETVPATITTTHTYSTGGVVEITDDPTAGDQVGNRDYNDARYASVGTPLGIGTGTDTISSGVIAPTFGSDAILFYTIDTEGGAASDTLTSITGGSAGVLLFLQITNDARTVTCQNGVNLCLGGGMDFQLDSTKDKLCLICVSSGTWHEVSRSSNV